MPTINATAALTVSNIASVAEAQTELAGANLAVTAVAGARTALDFYMIKVMIDGVASNPQQLLAFLLACEAASSVQHKFQIGDVIEKIVGDAYALSGELWGLRNVRRSIGHPMIKSLSFCRRSQRRAASPLSIHCPRLSSEEVTMISPGSF